MARCSCQGATCNCVIVAGSGVDVSGAGSVANPYVLNATGDFSSSLQVQDTDSLNLTLRGEGSKTEPFTVSGDVSLDMAGLSDVLDADGPKNGEVPVYVNDHWEFQAPPTTPPGAVTVGDGITGDGSGARPLTLSAIAQKGVKGTGTSADPLQANVSGVWGAGSMAGFPADKTLGTPVYVDDAGQLRVRPTPTVRHAADPIGAYATGFAKGTTATVWKQTGSLVSMQFSVKRTGAELKPDARGRISIKLGDLAADLPKPGMTTTAAAFTSGITVAAIGSDGQVFLRGIDSGDTWPTNEERIFEFTYQTDAAVIL